MPWLRLHSRSFGTVAALFAWLLLATHPCVDVGGAHTPVAPHHTHAEADQRAEAAHSECLLTVTTSSDRDLVSPLAALDLVPAAATLVTVEPSESVPMVSSVDRIGAR